MGNLGYLYNKVYYDHINKESESVKIEDATIRDYKISKVQDMKVSELNTDDIFEIRFLTTYPGLLIGVGYTHEIEGDNCFKLGMSFDYTTGLPVIPGTSIKGTLRDAFPGVYEEMAEKEINQGKKEKYKEMALQRRAYIKQKLDELEVNYEDHISFIKNLEKSIFDGLIEADEETYKIGSTTRDVFFDAEIDLSKAKDKLIVSEDYITPHGKDELLNPKPIKFLKVSPDITIKFSFRLPENYIGLRCVEKEIERKEIQATLNSRQKIELFISILCELGVGAKTNVGYGQLCIINKDGQIERAIQQKNEVKEKEKIKNMDIVERIMFELEKESHSNIQKKLAEIVKQFDNIEIVERKKLAAKLKEFLLLEGMWPGETNKQQEKVKKIEAVLKS